jgi:CHAD domain-containing protein
MTLRSVNHGASRAVAASLTGDGVARGASLAQAVHAALAADGAATAAPTPEILASLRNALRESAASSAPHEAVDVRDRSAVAGDGAVGPMPVRRDAAGASIGVNEPVVLLAYRYLADQARAISQSAEAASAGESPEGVHQMRVAIRRTRAALKVFRPMLPRARTRELGTGLRWLARTLGRVRDLDVYQARLANQLAMLEPDEIEALSPYRAHLQREYAEARSTLTEALEGARYGELMGAFAGMVAEGPSAAALRRWDSLRICDGAPAYLDAALRRVRRRGRRIDAESPPEALHELRIRAKRLRYLMEIFVPVYRKRLDRLVKPVRRLQDRLGEYQDACVAMGQLRAYGESIGRSRNRQRELMALGRLLQIESEAADAARERFSSEWRRFDRKLDPSRVQATVEKSHD